MSVDNKMWWKVWILTTVDFLLRGARAVRYLSSLCLGMVSLWTSSSPATEWQKPVDPLFTSSVSICSEPIHDKEHLAKHPSLGSRTVGVEQFVVPHCDPAETIRERSTPDPEALVPALHFWGIVPQSQTVFPSMSKCFLRSPPWGVPVRYSRSPVAELSPLCVATSYVLWPCPPILWWYVKYTAARNCCFLYTELRLWSCCDFPSPTSELPLLCVTEILKGVIVAETTPCTVMMVIWWM